MKGSQQDPWVCCGCATDPDTLRGLASTREDVAWSHRKRLIRIAIRSLSAGRDTNATVADRPLQQRIGVTSAEWAPPTPPTAACAAGTSRLPRRGTASEVREDEIRSIALVDALGDHGHGTYTHELAEGLAANGVVADVFTTELSPAVSFARRHRVFPVLGSVLFKQRARLRSESALAVRAAPPLLPTAAAAASRERPRTMVKARLRERWLPLELAALLKRRQYDLVWTQWPMPDSGGYGPRFLGWCRRLGIPLVHTVHNVLPHERFRGDVGLYHCYYAHAQTLVVHSHCAAAELRRHFPEHAHKAVLARFGTYTVYPRVACSRVRVREELGVPDGRPIAMVFGNIRPYKNVEGVLGALGRLETQDAVLVVAGTERGDSETGPSGDLLARTRTVAARLGVLGRVRLLPGPFSPERTSELFEAADVVILPYAESWGSGVLLLAMTFGKHIVASQTGGMDEYLAGYPPHTLLTATTPEAIAAGIGQALRALRERPPNAPPDLSELQWPAIARSVLEACTAEAAPRTNTAPSTAVAY